MLYSNLIRLGGLLGTTVNKGLYHTLWHFP